MSPEYAVRLWKSIYLHFTTLRYDVIKCNGAIKISKKEIEQRSNSFYNFANYFKGKDTQAAHFLIANFLVGNMKAGFEIEEQYINEFLKWQGRRESITYIFKNEFQSIIDNYNDFDFTCKSPHDSKLLTDYMHGKFSPETLVLIDKYYKENFLEKWVMLDSENDWFKNVFRLYKYRNIVRHDPEKIIGVINSIK